MPLVLPPVVGGVALFTVLGRSGLLGRPLYELTGFAFPFTPYAVVLAQVFVALPYLVLVRRGCVAGLGPAVRGCRGDARSSADHRVPAG